jgi:hypothetical protein
LRLILRRDPEEMRVGEYGRIDAEFLYPEHSA